MGEETSRKGKRKASEKSIKETKKAKKCGQEQAQKLSKGVIGGESNPCHVCGEKARSYNFGGMSCNCCKSFFRHFVLNNVKDNSSIERLKKDCKFRGNCEINQMTRKKCKTCRFFKCVKIGMDPNWVLSDFKKIQELKQKSSAGQIEIEQQILPITESSNNEKLSDEDVARVENISKYYKSACEQIPYMFPSRKKNEVVSTTKTRILLIGLISTSIRRFVYFAKMIPEFANLSLHDQTNLLRRSGMQMGMLRGSVTFDFDKLMITSFDNGFPENYPDLAEIRNICPHDLTEMHTQLYRRIRTIAPDEASIMLLIPVVLFSDCGLITDGCTEFEDLPAINSAQEFYSGLLEKYVKFKHGEAKGRLTFAKLLSQLVELTQVCQLHQGLPLNLSEHQVDKMHKHLLELQRKSNISPPPNQKLIGPERNQFRELKKYYQKETACKSNQPSRVEPPEIMKPSETARNSDAFQLLIRTFVNITGEWGIKPANFACGPHIGINRAFMRRIPELLMDPWDCLVNETNDY